MITITICDYLDELCGYVCKYFPEISEKLKEKAKSKLDYSERLNSLDGDSIIYSDIDNTFIRRPLAQMVENVFREVSVIIDTFLMKDSLYENIYNSSFYGLQRMFLL